MSEGEQAPALVAGSPSSLAGRAVEIRTLWQQYQAVRGQLEARLLEAIWQARAEAGDEGRFGVFCESLDFFPGRVRRALPAMAAAWAVARQRRDMREMAVVLPQRAVALVRRYTDAGLNVADQADEEVVRLLSLPPKAQRRELRDLLYKQRPAADEASVSGDEEKDDGLTSSRRPLAAEILGLRRDEQALAQRIERIVGGLETLPAGGLSDARHDDLVRLIDRVHGTLDTLFAALRDFRDDDGAAT